MTGRNTVKRVGRSWRRLRRPSHGVVVAYLALFVALGGSSYAALRVGSRQVIDNSLRSNDLRDNGIRSRDIRDGSLLPRDFRAGRLPSGPRGPRGAPGPAGPAAPAASGRITQIPRQATDYAVPPGGEGRQRAECLADEVATGGGVVLGPGQFDDEEGNYVITSVPLIAGRMLPASARRARSTSGTYRPAAPSNGPPSAYGWYGMAHNGTNTTRTVTVYALCTPAKAP